MRRYTVIFAIYLVLVGLAGYFATAAASVTALIPAFFGAALLVTLIWKQKGAMAALVLAALGLLGSAPGLLSSVRWMGGEAVDRPVAVVCQSLMAIACVAFLVTFFATPRPQTALNSHGTQ